MNAFDFNLLGFVGLGIAVIFIQWRMGSNKVASEVIDTYKTQVQQLREELATEKKGREDDRHNLKNQIQELALQVATMKGANDEKDQKIKDFTEIFQGMSPGQQQYQKDMRDFTAGVAKYMDTTAQILTEIQKNMVTLNKKG